MNYEEALNNYINFYKKLYNDNIFIDVDDKNELDSNNMISNKNTKNVKNGIIYDFLIPEPCVGQVRYHKGEKKVYLIMLNPGFAGNEKDEQQDNDFRKELWKVLKQDENNEIWEFSNNWQEKAGAKYWYQKINQADKDKSLLEKLKNEEKWKDNTIHKFSKHFCVIETLGYHSYHYNPNETIRNLKAFKVAEELIKELINLAIEDDNIMIVFGRKGAFHIFEKYLNEKNIRGNTKNIIIDHAYNSKLTLGVFGDGNHIGDYIYNFLK